MGRGGERQVAKKTWRWLIPEGMAGRLSRPLVRGTAATL